MRTRDLTPYLNTRSADIMANAWLADNDLVSHDLLTKARPDELRRFFIAMTNLSYLSTLYIYSKVYVKTGGFREVPPRKQYPPAVFRLLRRNPTISDWWSPDRFSKPITSAQQLRAFTSTFERATAMLRRYLKSHAPEQTRMYRRNLAWLEPLLKEPEIETCETSEQCAPYPAHSQFVNVQLPLVTLILVRMNGKFEIIAIGVLEGLW
ncbi:MAG TPA: hypothetical protein VGJ69_06250 [Pyrinomonadaceae bacterium]